MNLAAVLQIVGVVLVILAAALLSPTLGVFVAGILFFGLGVWTEVGED